MAYDAQGNWYNDDADRERQQKSAASNQNPTVKNANQRGQMGAPAGFDARNDAPSGGAPDGFWNETGGGDVRAHGGPAVGAPGSPVAGLPGFVWNSAGGYEPGGAGNPVPGMPGATYGPDGYTVIPPGGQQPAGGAPTAPAPTSGYSIANAFGSKANLDKAYLEQQIQQSAKKGGKTLSAEELAFWVDKVSKPDTYSDGKIRVGWNPYREGQLLGKSGIGPQMAGDEGIVADGVPDGQGGGPSFGGGGSYVPPGGAAPVDYTPATYTPPGGPAQVTAKDATYTPTGYTPVSGPEKVGYTGATYTPPTHQQYNFTDRNVASQTISPETIGQYRAGTVDQFTPTSTGDTMTTAQMLAKQLAQYAAPDTGALKEQQKETLNALRQQRMGGIDTYAAARGVSGGAPMAERANIEDAFAGALTGSYRDIDQQAQQQAFENMLSALGANTELGNAMTAQGQSNYTTGLSGKMAQESLNQADAASGQARTAQMQDVLSALFGQNLSNQQLGFAKEQAQAGENQFGSTLRDSQSKFGSTLAEQQAQFGSNLAKDQNQFNANFNKDQAQFGSTLKNNQDQFGANFAKDQNQFGANLAKDQNQFGATLGNNQSQYASDLAERQAQFLANLGLNQNQFNATLANNQSQFGANLQRGQNMDFWNLLLGLM